MGVKVDQLAAEQSEELPNRRGQLASLAALAQKSLLQAQLGMALSCRSLHNLVD